MIEEHEGELICCGEPMKIMEEKGVEMEGKEKHVPIVTIEENRIKVKVGSIPHPMEENHFIELIEIMKGNQIIASVRLSPGDKPESEFCPESGNEGITARIYCNIHGLWKSG
jgi:superoxide reductase